MADLVRHAVGVDLVDVALRFALGEAVPDEVALPRFQQPLAIRFLTAEPGPAADGRVTRIGSLEPVLAADGVVQADTYLQVGEAIRPVRLDGDRRGYVIAVADTNVAALAAPRRRRALLEVEVEAAGYEQSLRRWARAPREGNRRFPRVPPSSRKRGEPPGSPHALPARDAHGERFGVDRRGSACGSARRCSSPSWAPDQNSAIDRRVRARARPDELVTIVEREPEQGEATFQWILARGEA